jgi:uncharacterized membrane protein
LWILQQRLYHYAEAMGRALVRIELVMLALVSLLPFTTALIGEYGTHTTAAVIYSVHLVALAVVGVLRVWYFLAHRELQTPEFNAAIARSMRVRAGVFLVCSLLSFGLAFMVPGYNLLGMLPACLSPLLVRD